MSEETKSAAQLAAETKAAFEKSLDAVREIATEAKGKAENGEKLTASMKEKADEALLGMNSLKAQLTEIEQKLARGGDVNGDEAKSLGERFTSADEFKALQTGGVGAKFSMQVKADLTTATTNSAGSVGAGIAPNRLPGIQMMPTRRMTIPLPRRHRHVRLAR